MNITVHRHENSKVAEIESHEILIRDLPTTLDLMADVLYHHDCGKILIYKENICPEFFDLSTRLAGEILQKFTDYHVKIAIVGDFDNAGKNLSDFIRECNRGNQVLFVSARQDALERLHV